MTPTNAHAGRGWAQSLAPDRCEISQFSLSGAQLSLRECICVGACHRGQAPALAPHRSSRTCPSSRGPSASPVTYLRERLGKNRFAIDQHICSVSCKYTVVVYRLQEVYSCLLARQLASSAAVQMAPFAVATLLSSGSASFSRTFTDTTIRPPILRWGNLPALIWAYSSVFPMPSRRAASGTLTNNTSGWCS